MDTIIIFAIITFLTILNHTDEILYYTPFIKKSDALKNRVLKYKKYRRSSVALNEIFILNTMVYVFFATYIILLNTKTIESTDFVNMVYTNFGMPIFLRNYISKIWTIITCNFVHVDIFHFMSNITVLYFLSNLIRRSFNNAKIWTIYLLGGIGGGMATLFLFNFMPPLAIQYFSFPSNPYTTNIILIGASASIFSLMSALTYKNPNYVYSFFFFKVKIKYIFIYYLLISFLSILSSNNVGGNMAHLGGALVGFLLMDQYRRGNNFFKPAEKINKKLYSFSKKIKKIILPEKFDF